MTTQELYNKVLAKEVTQQKFLYEVRRDINLPFITSSNNFKDTVQILKNKGMISEKKLSTGKQDVEIYANSTDKDASLSMIVLKCMTISDERQIVRDHEFFNTIANCKNYLISSGQL